MKYNKTNTLIIIFLIINVFKIILNKPVEEEGNNSNKKLTYKEINDKEIINKKTKKMKINSLNKNIIKTKLRIISEYDFDTSSGTIENDDTTDESPTVDSTYFSSESPTDYDIITEEAILFKRIDGYHEQNNNISFKSHFITLKYYNFSNAELYITANIYTTPSRILNNEETTITCFQSYNNGYLLTFICSHFIDNGKFFSIEITKMDIVVNNKNFKNLEKSSNNLNKTLNDTKIPSLDVLYQNHKFNRFTIKEISDIILKDKLYFNLIGNFDNDNEEDNYDIKTKNEKNEEINVSCNVPKNQKDNAIIACNSTKNGLKKKLIIEEDMYSSKIKNNILILNTDGNKEINIPQKKTLSVGAIIGITLAGIVLVVPFIFYIVKYLVKNKDDNNQIVEIREEYFRPDINNNENNVREENKGRNKVKVKNNRNIDNSKEIIFANN